MSRVGARKAENLKMHLTSHGPFQGPCPELWMAREMGDLAVFDIVIFYDFATRDIVIFPDLAVFDIVFLFS